MPLTKKQRDWVRKRNGNQCVHCWVGEDGKWHRCSEHENLDVHHVVPEGWGDEHVKSMTPNSPTNLVTLCGKHHIGRKKKRGGK